MSFGPISLDEVKSNLAKLLKADEEKIYKLFSGGRSFSFHHHRVFPHLCSGNIRLDYCDCGRSQSQ
jgi:hypothetical protein